MSGFVTRKFRYWINVPRFIPVCYRMDSFRLDFSKIKGYELFRCFNTKQNTKVAIKSFSSLYKADPSNRSKIEYILNLYEHEKYTGMSFMPERITSIEMRDLLAVFPDETEILRTLKFFYKRECARQNTVTRKAIKRNEMIETKIDRFGPKATDRNEWDIGIFDQNGNIVYGLWHNTLHNRVPKQAVRDYRHRHLLRQAAMFGQKLIVDLDYDEFMKQYEIRLLATQIGMLYYENRVNHNFPECLPFDVHFTNCGKAQKTLQALNKHIKRMDQLRDYFHEESYLNLPQLFPKQRLVYLSPHSRESLRNYSHDDIYILGAYNDRSTRLKVSNVKAENEGIRCYRLPLAENVIWGHGSMNLCLNQCSNMLHAVKATGDWQTAIQIGVPQRKLVRNDKDDF